MAKYIFEEGVVLHVNSKAYVYATFGNERARQRCSLSNLTFRHVVVYSSLSTFEIDGSG